jgi:hypothetical protein
MSGTLCRLYVFLVLAAARGTSGLSPFNQYRHLHYKCEYPHQGSAIRWLPDISEGYTHDNSKNYSSIIGYLNSAAVT